MRQIIEAERTQYAKRRKLLEIIQRRGPLAFAALRTALIKAGNANLARHLSDNVNADTPNHQKDLEGERPLSIDLKTTESQDETRQSEQRCMLDIGDDYFVVACHHNGQLSIHIRQYENSQTGKLFPTKKGVTFPLYRWLNLESLESTFADALETHSKDGEQRLRGWRQRHR